MIVCTSKELQIFYWAHCILVTVSTCLTELRLASAENSKGQEEFIPTSAVPHCMAATGWKRRVPQCRWWPWSKRSWRAVARTACPTGRPWRGVAGRGGSRTPSGPGSSGSSRAARSGRSACRWWQLPDGRCGAGSSQTLSPGPGRGPPAPPSWQGKGRRLDTFCQYSCLSYWMVLTMMMRKKGRKNNVVKDMMIIH